MQEKIEIEHHGTVYTGQYYVEGINKRQLVVYYKGRRRVDSFDPRAEEPGFVECLAENLLLQMVSEEAAEVEQENQG
jgi:hypothetical protein